MKLSELRKNVGQSSPEDWHKITCWGSGAGPSYRYSLSSDYSKELGVQTVAHGHSNTATLIDDIDISIAWGFDPDEDISDRFKRRDMDFSDFLPKMPDESVSRAYADIFYRGSLVDRELFVVADGGRYYVPIPHTEYPNKTSEHPTTIEEYGAPRHLYSTWQVEFAKLLHGLRVAAPPYSYVLDRIEYEIDDRPISEEGK